MKWKYINKEEEKEREEQASPQQYFISASGSSSGSVTKAVENGAFLVISRTRKRC